MGVVDEWVGEWVDELGYGEGVQKRAVEERIVPPTVPTLDLTPITR